MAFLTKPLKSLSISGVKGDFLRGFKVDVIQWKSQQGNEVTKKVSLENTRITWQFINLLTGKLHVDKLSIEKLTIANSDQAESETGSISDPDFAPLFLPIPLQLRELVISEFNIVKTSASTAERRSITIVSLRHINGNAFMRGRKISIEELSLSYGDYRIEVEGEVITSSDYVLSLSGHINDVQRELDLEFVATGGVVDISTTLVLEKPQKLEIDLTLFPFEKETLFKGKASVDLLLNESLLSNNDRDFQRAEIVFQGTPERVEFKLDGEIIDGKKSVDGRKNEENSFSVVGVWSNDKVINVTHSSITWLEGELTAVGKIGLDDNYNLKCNAKLVEVQFPGLSDPVTGGLIADITFSEKMGLYWSLENINLRSPDKNNPVLISGHIRGKELLPYNMDLFLGQSENKLIVTGGLTHSEESSNTSQISEIRFSGSIDKSYSFDLACSGRVDDTLEWDIVCGKGLFGLALTHDELQWEFDHPVHIGFSTETARLSVQPFCLHHESTFLCHQSELLYDADSDFSLPIVLSGLPWSWVSSYFPREVSLSGFINGLATLKLATGGEFEVEGSLNSANAHVFVSQNELAQKDPKSDVGIGDADHQNDTQNNDDQEEKGVLDIAVERVTALGYWSREQSKAEFSLITRDRGEVQGKVSLDPVGRVLGEIGVSEFDMESLEVFLDLGDHIDGVLQADLRLTGNLPVPRIEGEFSVEDGQYQSSLFPVVANDIRIKGQFRKSMANFAGTFVTPEGGAELRGKFDWSQPQWISELNLSAEQLLIRPNKNSRVWVRPSITVKATPLKIDINGELVVPKARIEIKNIPVVAASRSSDVVELDSVASDSSWQYTTKLNVSLGDDVEFKGFGLEGALTGQVDLMQSDQIPLSALGGIQLQGGKYTAFGQKLTVRQGDLIFAGQLDNPNIQVDAIRNDIVDDNVVVGLKVTGRASSPSITLFSEPGMSEEDRLSYLLTGRLPSDEDSEDTNSSSKMMLSQAAIGLSISQSEGIISKAAGKMGVDSFQIGASAGEEGVEEVRLSGKVNDRLYVQYGLGVFDKLNSILLRYQVKQGLYLEAVSGKVNSLDLMFTFDRD